ncbi:Wzz/FepE/Etk N-terminal domain-containing protein [Teredinibacter sp. KSP-S5-2]|uniref:Wzz/FepE/Etk N-terminal domain-containing protein n=1 Tax=Teredinibacter sp. KSP-S5-2 TaxID=3034506 RepID=UPI002934A81E|nr:Wzz/FepE/Etk N-terminal domain-containing protein [Teredinibacter sp. KSP-S5-2]WNO07865.1 Wzz/FepE/Etk N-terminal domain-containing protein [Teredinibacter sp. KSP-S5-2]
MDKNENQVSSVGAVCHSNASSTSSAMFEENIDLINVDLIDIVSLLWGNKYTILISTFLIVVLVALYSIYIPNVYKSDALLAPADTGDGSGIAGLAGNLGGLASFAGINISGSGDHRTRYAIEKMVSRDFIVRFIKKHQIGVDLIASKSWDKDNDRLILDSSIFNKEGNKWISKPPTDEELYKAFVDRLSVDKNSKTGYVYVSLEFYSPAHAQRWLTMLIQDINTHVREKEVLEATRSIEYLSSQLSNTSVAELRAAFYQLIEEQTKKIMLSEVREQFVFDMVDPPNTPDNKFKPRRAVMVVVAALLASILTSFGLIIFFMIKVKLTGKVRDTFR